MMETKQKRWPHRGSTLKALVVVMWVAGFLNQATGTLVDWAVTIADPNGWYTGIHDAIRENALAAGREWGQHLVAGGSGSTLHVIVEFQEGAGTAWGSHGWIATEGNVGWMGDVDGISVWELGPQTAIRTGMGYDPGRRDIVITIATGYMPGEWWDPNPTQRTDPIPSGMGDGYSTILHEMGHGLGFIGWRDWTTGALPGAYMSTYDRWVVMDVDGDPWFEGPNAMAVYGGPVPLTQGNLMHYGNWAADGTAPGQELAGVGLMNGVTSFAEFRWRVEDLDIAILNDLGYQMIPEPSVGVLIFLGIGVMRAARRRKAA